MRLANMEVCCRLTALAGKNAGEIIILLAKQVGAQCTRIVVSTVGLLKHSVTYRATGTIILWQQLALSLTKILLQVIQQRI